jgi:hypothetical protein
MRLDDLGRLLPCDPSIAAVTTVVYVAVVLALDAETARVLHDATVEHWADVLGERHAVRAD